MLLPLRSFAKQTATIEKIEPTKGVFLDKSVTKNTYKVRNSDGKLYYINAEASDNSGAATTSTAVSITVAAAPPVCLPVSASGDDGNVASNVLDNNVVTRWSANGDGQWIQFCQGTAINMSGVQIAFYSGNARQSPI